MPGFRGKNLRSGDLAEQLGVLLLQNVSLVSPIPRTEDVGIDVVATLIKDYDGRRYIAEDSFFVQIKSASVTEITFKNEQVKWLVDLQLPFFIASVDKKKSTISLYSTNYLSDALVHNPNRKEITFDLTDNSDYDCCDSNESIKIPVGPCVISWSFETFTINQNFFNDFYTLLKCHIIISKKSMETRRVGVVELVSWETGKEPVVLATKIKILESSSKTEEIEVPYLSSYLARIALGQDIPSARSLYRLTDKVLLENGHFVIENGEKQLIPFDASNFVIRKSED